MISRAKPFPMDNALRESWTQEEFFNWAQGQESRYEFDGFEPVAMTGGNAGHALGIRGLHRALDARLRQGPCQFLGTEAGVETINKAVRYPDALITWSKFNRADLAIPGVIVVFEVTSPSPSSIRADRIEKVAEYAAVPSILRYVIVETAKIELTVLERTHSDEPWRTTILSKEAILQIPELGIEIPVAEIYEDIIASDTRG